MSRIVLSCGALHDVEVHARDTAVFLTDASGILVAMLRLVAASMIAGSVILLPARWLFAGVRLGNALFTTLAALGLSLAMALTGGGNLPGDRRHSIAAMAFCLGVSLGAVALGAHRWQRPSHDRMLQGLVVAMPAAAFGRASAHWPASGAVAAIPMALSFSFAALLTVIGIRRREHAALLGALVQFACLAFALRELTGLPLYTRLIVCGSVLLVLGVAIDRGLRRPRYGITSAAQLALESGTDRAAGRRRSDRGAADRTGISRLAGPGR